MAEGEAPEIPQHLVEGVTSVEAHEQETRREYQIRERARVLQIPLKELETNEAVLQYVTVLRNIKAAAERVFPLLERAENRAGHPLMSTESPERTRLRQAHNLYEGAALILEEGFASVDGPRKLEVIPDYIRSITRYLDRAAKPLGLRVTEADPNAVWRDAPSRMATCATAWRSPTAPLRYVATTAARLPGRGDPLRHLRPAQRRRLRPTSRSSIAS